MAKQSRIQRWDGPGTVYVQALLAVSIHRKGYHDPGVCTGPPERCYPPEGEDERTITAIELEGVELPADIVVKVAPEIQEVVDAADVSDQA